VVFGLQQLPQAEFHAIQVGCAKIQRHFDCLFDQFLRILLVQLEDLQEFARPSPIRFALSQFRQEPFGAFGPLLAPAAQQLGMFESAGTLLQQG
jgi:hypothetical protein